MTGEPSDDQGLDRVHLVSIRKRLGLTQADMAKRLGMGLRAFNDLETGISKVRPIHVLAAERVSLSEAAGRENPALADRSVIEEARALIRGSNN